MSPEPVEQLLPAYSRIIRRRRETPDIETLWLSAGHSRQLDVLPGQFNMMALPGIGEVPISVSGIDEASGLLMHTVRAVGAVTRAITDLEKQQEIGLRGPYGQGWPFEAARGKDVLIIAGGLGLAPLRLLWKTVLSQRGQYGRVNMLIGARTPEELLFVEELRELRARFDVSVEVTVDHAAADWHGHVGVVTQLIQRAEFDPDDSAAFLCGPEVMMRFCTHELLLAGLSQENIYLSMERNMHCGVGRCGHCQLGPKLICRDGPVFSYADIGPWLDVDEA